MYSLIVDLLIICLFGYFVNLQLYFSWGVVIVRFDKGNKNILKGVQIYQGINE